MKAITSKRINKDVLNHLRQLDVNVSDYINKLIMKDLLNQSFEDTSLKVVVDNAVRDENKSLILQEMKLIGALANIPTRLSEMSKGDDIVYHTLLKKNIELLQLEYDFPYSKETRYLIKQMYKQVTDINKSHFEPYQNAKKLMKSGNKKIKK
jgi:hypothetical protein